MKLLFPFVALFCFILYTSIKKSSFSLTDQKTTLLEREHEANSTRRKDINNMDYITIPYEKLPFISNPPENIAIFQEKILTFKEKRILNLGGISNTDLKLQYGPANLTALTEYDENYLNMVNTLDKWSQVLIRDNYISEAIGVLEVAVELGCDSSTIYTNLNKLYKNQNIDKTQYLIDKISATDSSMKNIIINKLKA